MDIVKPTEAELAALLAEHAHRYPEKARFTVPDGDNDVTLPVLIGNPSGACKMPAGRPSSPAWSTTVAATFRLRDDAEAMTEALVAECVLWPNAATWSAWTQRWAALPEIAQVVVRRKTGASMSMLEEPAAGETPPEALQPLLERRPGTVWRRLKPGAETLHAAIAPPNAGIWRLFVDTMKKRDAKHAELARDFAAASLVAVIRPDGSSLAADELLDRWPGQMLLVGLVVAHLGGLTAKVELGEW